MSAGGSHYSRIAILLHWLIAVSVLAMIPMGLWMTAAIDQPDKQALAYRIFQIHKSIGFLILALTIFRIFWRLTHRAPSMPQAMKGWETFAARVTHIAFYMLLLALPLTGWLYVSTGWTIAYDKALEVATSWFGLFGIPHVPGVAGLDADTRRVIAFQAMGVHSTLSWGAVVLIALHIGAALKHHFINRDGVLVQMMPFLKHRKQDAPAPRPKQSQLWVERSAGIGLVLVIGIAGAIAAMPAPRAATEATKAVAAPAAQAEAPITPGTAKAWTIDMAASSIRFSGAHAGNPFKGRFDKWEGKVWFDPADLSGSKAVAIVRTESAHTGDATQEASLQGQEWFDPANYPTARFETSAFRKLNGDRYEAVGTIRIKTITVPVTLAFTFREENGAAKVAGSTELDRTALGMGMLSDPDAAWVSKLIGVEIELTAKPAA